MAAHHPDGLQGHTDNGVHFSPPKEGPGMGAALFFRFQFFVFFFT